MKTVGASNRGARRIITGNGGEQLYTGDHYAAFSVIDVNGGKILYIPTAS